MLLLSILVVVLLRTIVATTPTIPTPPSRPLGTAHPSNVEMIPTPPSMSLDMDETTKPPNLKRPPSISPELDGTAEPPTHDKRPPYVKRDDEPPRKKTTPPTRKCANAAILSHNLPFQRNFLLHARGCRVKGSDDDWQFANVVFSGVLLGSLLLLVALSMCYVA